MGFRHMLRLIVAIAFGIAASAAHAQCCRQGEAPAGDNATTMDFNGGRLNLLRRMTAAGTAPNELVQLDNFSRMPVAAYGLYPQVGALMVTANGHPDATASLDAGIFTLNLFGDKPYSAQDVAVQSTVNQNGSDSSWLFDGFSRDLTGKPPNDFSQVGMELDMAANGPDAPTSAYDPLHTYRVFLSLNAGVKSWPGWEANHQYSAGSIIEQKSRQEAASVYIAKQGGMSGATQPLFPDSGAVEDGSVTWAYSEPYAVEYGRGIWLDSGQAGKDVSFGSGFASNARFQDAPIDVSQASLASPTSAGIRLAAGMPIDFSGDGTAAGQNRHVLQYAVAALTYSVDGVAAMSVAETGLASFPGQIQAPLVTPRSSSSPCVTGTRIADANYEYVCVATNSWKRAALSAF